MMYFIALGFLGAAMAQTPISPIDCSGEAEGTMFWGCKAYHRCNRGRVEFVECIAGEVFDEAVGGCNRMDQVRTPCAMDFRDQCGPVDDLYGRRFAVTDYVEDTSGRRDNNGRNINNGRGLRCTYFYVCYGGIFWGTQKCSGGNVFNDLTQRCEDPQTLSGECGLQQDVRGK